MKKFQMFVITHKKIEANLIEDYVPIQVGKKNTKLELPYINDDTGNNISEKNKNYCELTAIYWIWKNYDLPSYVGICHYRRFFVYGIFSHMIDEKFVEKVMKKYDVILPYKYKTESNVYNHYISSPSGVEKDLINLKNIIKNKYPDYYDDYNKVMNSKSISYCNMVVMSKDNFKKYNEWLFDILFDLETVTDLTNYTQQQQRIYGFLSEFLLNVWIEKNNLSIKYCNMYYIEKNKFKNLLKKVKLGIRSLFL